MAKYKLTTVATYSDNTVAEDPQYQQQYVDRIAEDTIDNWDTATVTLVVDDGETYTAHRSGNRNKGQGDSRLRNHPWHKASDERPETAEDCKLLGWQGDGAYDFDIIKYRVRDRQFCDRNGHPLPAAGLWWRTLEKPNV